MDKEAPVKGVENLVVVDKEEEVTKAKQKTNHIQIRLHHLQSVLYLLLRRLRDAAQFLSNCSKNIPPPHFVSNI